MKEGNIKLGHAEVHLHFQQRGISAMRYPCDVVGPGTIYMQQGYEPSTMID